MTTTQSSEAPRSPQWPRVERAHLAIEPTCVCCGTSWKPGTKVQVHHVFPVAYIRAVGRPDLELDSRNLVTLCETEAGKPGEDHHLLVGHLGDFEAANPSSRTDAVHTYRGMTGRAIRASAAWSSEVARRLPVLSAMTSAEKQQLRQFMDQMMPAAAAP